MVQVRDYDNARRLLTQPAHYALVPLSTCVLLAVRRLNEHILKRAAWKTDHAQRPSEKAAGTDGCVTEVPGGRVPDDVDRLSRCVGVPDAVASLPLCTKLAWMDKLPGNEVGDSRTPEPHRMGFENRVLHRPDPWRPVA